MSTATITVIDLLIRNTASAGIVSMPITSADHLFEIGRTNPIQG
jgi:hypothetical protein